MRRIRPFRRPDTTSARLFVTACKKAGSRNLVNELLDPFRLLGAGGNAAPEVAAAVQLFQPRPFYSARELAYFWPLISIGLAAKDKAWKPSPERLHERLVELKLPRMRQWDGRYDFMWRDAAQQFFIVQDVRAWSKVRLTQRRFEEIMHGQD